MPTLPRLLSSRLVSLAAAATLMPACSSSDQVGITDRAQIVQAVTGQLNIWGRAINNRSQDTLEALYLNSPDVAIVWLDGQRTRGWKEATAHWKKYFSELTQLNFVVENPVVEPLARNVALATFRTSVDAVSTVREHRPGRGTQVWVRDPKDDRWKIRAEHQSLVPEKTGPP